MDLTGNGGVLPAGLLQELPVLRAARELVLLLDYDGTLVPHTAKPERALPDPALLELLRRLANRPATEVHIVSGRTAEFLDRALDGLPIYLHAEHGAQSREPGNRRWLHRAAASPEWHQAVLPLLVDFARRTPGALVEFKQTALAWHWRGADPLVGAQRAEELSRTLAGALARAPAELVWGDKVLELRPLGVHKGLISGPHSASGKHLLAAGNDRTDEDLFEALSDTALTIVVGERPSAARFRVTDVWGLRAFLGRLAEPGT
jgi:trehalose 6-phosphate synthase/phosphatase